MFMMSVPKISVLKQYLVCRRKRRVCLHQSTYISFSHISDTNIFLSKVFFSKFGQELDRIQFGKDRLNYFNMNASCKTLRRARNKMIILGEGNLQVKWKGICRLRGREYLNSKSQLLTSVVKREIYRTKPSTKYSPLDPYYIAEKTKYGYIGRLSKRIQKSKIHYGPDLQYAAF